MGNTQGGWSQPPHGASIGLGLAALGRPGYINLGHGEDLGDRSVEGLQRRAHEVLDAAWGAGVRHVDVARSYGLAERFLGTWLAGRPEVRQGLRVGSKWGYAYTAGWQVRAEQHEVKEHSLAQLRRQYPESCAALGGPPDLYQVHSVTPDSPVLGDDAVLRELAELRSAGVQVGLTTSGPAQAQVIARALEIVRDGRPLFTSIQTTWNLLERAAEPALEEAHGAGVEVIVKEALANGRLTDRGDDHLRAALRDHAATHGVGIDAVALAAVCSRPWAAVVLSGAATVAHLRANLGAATVTITADDLQRWESLTQQPEEYWSQRAELPWS
jgi:aryl-alcohol dehydrogenase-like predicted oxidoreductase